MKLLGLGALVLLSSAAFATPVWYNGDDDENGGYAAIQGANGFGSEYTQYENFTWNSSSNAGSIMATMVASSSFSQVYWEIRQGMDAGTNSLGTLVASGTSNVNATFVSNWALNTSLDLYTMTGDISSVGLTNGGDYFLGMAIVSTGSTFVGGITSTSGANSVGSPINDHNALYYQPSSSTVGAEGLDLSMGIGTSSAVPEPASLSVLGLGALALLKRRKK